MSFDAGTTGRSSTNPPRRGTAPSQHRHRRKTGPSEESLDTDTDTGKKSLSSGSSMKIKAPSEPKKSVGQSRDKSLSGATRASSARHSNPPAYRTASRIIPGNAKATQEIVETVDTIPVSYKASQIIAQDASGNPDFVDPTVLDMEIEKQQQHLNRMAMLRHSMGQPLEDSTTESARPSQPNFRGSQDDQDLFFDPARKSRTSIRSRRSTRAKGYGEWDLITSVKANELHEVAKYRSQNTGLTVVHARVESPEVHGYIVFRHRCDNHIGLPHILQHMVFLGSQNFPYPGMLDQLAVKCMADGTDAWTESDHACYLLKTAGKAGFLTLLPVYLDHLFHPSLSEAGYLTEVHHINPEGKDGGVCYLEMKATEHDPQNQANWAVMSHIYEPSSGYHYNYGGHFKEMRDYGSLAAVRNFHKTFYHPKNCCLIVCGDMEPTEIFGVITEFTMNLQSEVDQGLIGAPSDNDNPWEAEPLVEIAEESETVVLYPSDSEGFSLVKVAMIGVTASSDVTLAAGMDILITYLLHSPISPIQAEFVENNDGALATSVTVTKSSHNQTIYCFNFENVKTEDQELIAPRLRELFQNQMLAEVFDSNRMEFIVGHCCQEAMSSMENDAEDTIARSVISDFIYSFNDDPIAYDRRINYFYTLEQFMNQPASFWFRMLRILLNGKWATVYAVPNREVADKYHKDEAERQQENIDFMGEQGKKKSKARLRAAAKIQSKRPDPELFDNIQTPTISSIGFLGIERHDNPPFASDTLCNLYLDDINSNYVYLTVLMDTSELTLEEKKYLVLFADAILEAPYVDNSQRFFTYEQMIAGLSRDVLKYETHFGIDWDRAKGGTRFNTGNFSNLFCIRFQMEMKRVKEGFEWMQILLWHTKWQPDRLKTIAARLAHEVSHLLDHGPTMTRAMMTESLFQMNSNAKAMSPVRQQVFLERLAQDLPKSFKGVAKMLEAIRMVILRPENVTVHVATRLLRMEFYLTDKPEIRDAIAQLLRRTFDYTGWSWGYPTKRLANDPDTKWMKSMECNKRCRSEKILRMFSDEGAYLLQAAPGITEFNTPEYPVLLVAINYFCQNEGPFFRAMKSTGYASFAQIKLIPEQGLILFEIRATDLVKAYTVAFNIILEHLEEKTKEDTEDDSTEAGSAPEEEPIWTEHLLATAKSAAIFTLIDKENTPKTLALSSLLDYYRQLPSSFNRFVMDRISTVTLEEVQLMTRKYFRPLFINTTNCCVAAPNDDVPSIIKGLMDNCGKRLSLLPPVHQSEMSNFIAT